MKRESIKDIELAGRRWRIKKFDALTGSYISYKLLSQMLPGGVDKQLGNMPEGRQVMCKEDFISLQKDCLSVVYELKEAGANQFPMQIMMPNGSWGVEGLDDDTATVLALTIHALIFNVSGFFDGNTLKELTGSLTGLNFVGVKI
jgi:hypothetical protein